MKRFASLVVLVVVTAGCGSHQQRAAAPKPQPKPRPNAIQRTVTAPTTPPARVPRCTQSVRSLGSAQTAYVGFAPRGAVAYRAPGRGELARFGPENVNGYPTLF
ncbi:MAG: hypothetical protein ACXVPL_11635, partial [Actinomycetota bacterium]